MPDSSDETILLARSALFPALAPLGRYPAEPDHPDDDQREHDDRIEPDPEVVLLWADDHARGVDHRHQDAEAGQPAVLRARGCQRRLGV